jgi:hypothetical protein
MLLIYCWLQNIQNWSKNYICLFLLEKKKVRVSKRDCVNVKNVLYMEYANENTIDSQKRMKILLFEILQVHKLSDNLHPQMIFRIF